MQAYRVREFQVRMQCAAPAVHAAAQVPLTAIRFLLVVPLPVMHGGLQEAGPTVRSFQVISTGKPAAAAEQADSMEHRQVLVSLPYTFVGMLQHRTVVLKCGAIPVFVAVVCIPVRFLILNVNRSLYHPCLQRQPLLHYPHPILPVPVAGKSQAHMLVMPQAIHGPALVMVRIQVSLDLLFRRIKQPIYVYLRVTPAVHLQITAPMWLFRIILVVAR